MPVEGDRTGAHGSAAPSGARRGAELIAGSLRAMTSGQRWTAGLMFGLALAVLAFGLPTATRSVVPAAAGELETPAVDPSDVAPPTAAPPLTDTLVRPPRQPSSAPTVAEPSVPADASPAPPTTVAMVAVKVVALVEPATGVGDRTDEAMARRFLEAAGVTATYVPLGEAVATCDAVQEATLVVAGGPLPADLRRCLNDAGIMSLSFDDDGSLGPVAHAVSTRRGAARSLFDTAAQSGLSLDGDLGLAADERLRPTIEPLLPAVRAAGLDITAVEWLPPGEPPASAAVALVGAGVEGVLLATSVGNQSTIASQLRTFSPSVRLGVLDAADAVLVGSYPPVFDGAVAVTSVQHPWHAGAEAARAACRETWESAQTPPAVLSAGELTRALTWCQHAAMIGAAQTRSSDGFAPALLGLEVDSPITAPLGLLRDGGFGPSMVTVATWSAQCGCWASTAPFARTGSAHG